MITLTEACANPGACQKNPDTLACLVCDAGKPLLKAGEPDADMGARWAQEQAYSYPLGVDLGGGHG